MNRSYYLSCVLLVALLSLTRVSAQVSVWDGTYAPWTNGTGTESDPFLIENAQQLETIQLFDINGKMLLNEKSIGKKHQLNIEMLKPGMYFIRVSTTGNQIATLKLTVD